LKDLGAKEEIDWAIRLISTVRTIRAELNVPPAAHVQLQLKDASKESRARLERHQPLVMRLARLGGIAHVNAVAKGAAQAIIDEVTLILPLADVIDLEQERMRLKKESEKWAAEIEKIESKLGNKSFVERAPPEVVEEQRERKAEAEAMLAKLQAAQRSLSA
jgi:valyl-tRNA synthetase